MASHGLTVRRYNKDVSNVVNQQAEQVHLHLLREAGQARRSEIASALTQRVLWQSREAIRRNRPELSEDEQRLLEAEVRCGPEIASQLRACLGRVQ